MYDCILVNPLSIYHTDAEKKAPYLYNGTLSIASVLDAHGFRVRIIDMVCEDNVEGALTRRMQESLSDIKLVGITSMTAQLPFALSMATFLKQKYPSVPVILGGIHPTLYPEEMLNTGVVDYVCTGDGEYTMLELLQALKERGPTGGIPGLYYKRDAAVTYTGQRKDTVIDELPFFNYELIDYERYKHRLMTRGSQDAIAVRFGSVLTGMGCPYKCTFCINSNKLLYCGKYRPKSAQRILDEIEFLIKKYDITFFDLTDENFFIDKERVREFLSGVRKRKLQFKWFTSIRADYVSPRYVNDDILQEMRSAGCYRLGIGAESGSQRILDKLKKGIKTEDIYHAADRLTWAGIGASFSFMMGIPGETKDDVLSTIDMIRRVRASGETVAIIGPQIFRPYPGGELFEECVRDYHYRPPRNTSEWLQALNSFTGHENVDNLTWIADKEFLKKVSFYSDLANLNTTNIQRSMPRKLMLGLFKNIALARLKYHWFSWCLEMQALLAFKQLRAYFQQRREKRSPL